MVMIESVFQSSRNFWQEENLDKEENFRKTKFLQIL
jgi:hypothetical protein